MVPLSMRSELLGVTCREPDTLIERVLGTLGHHDVVPLVCWDERGFEELPAWGWARLREPESGVDRHVLLRPALRDAIQRRYRERWHALTFRFRPFRRRPLRLGRRFDPNAVTRYFHG